MKSYLSLEFFPMMIVCISPTMSELRNWMYHMSKHSSQRTLILITGQKSEARPTSKLVKTAADFSFSFTHFFAFFLYFLLSGAARLGISYIRTLVLMSISVFFTGVKSGSRSTSQNGQKNWYIFLFSFSVYMFFCLLLFFFSFLLMEL